MDKHTISLLDSTLRRRYYQEVTTDDLTPLLKAALPWWRLAWIYIVKRIKHAH